MDLRKKIREKKHEKIKGTLLVIFFREKGRKNRGKCWKNPKKEKNEKKTVRNSAFHQYDSNEPRIVSNGPL